MRQITNEATDGWLATSVGTLQVVRGADVLHIVDVKKGDRIQFRLKRSAQANSSARSAGPNAMQLLVNDKEEWTSTPVTLDAELYFV